SYEIGIAPHVSSDMQTWLLALFSALFFGAAWWFSRKPSKILEYVGKFLNPLFVVLLGVWLFFAFWQSLASCSDVTIYPCYQSAAFFTGSTNGYNPLDALASLAFGIIIVSTIRNMGVENPTTVAKDTTLPGSVSIVLMAITYT